MIKSFYEFDGEGAALFGIQDQPGYLTAFCKDQAEGAWANGSCVVKGGHDPDGDVTPDGTKGKILGSLKTPDGRYAYFVEWENKPRIAVFCVQEKMKLLKEPQ